MPARHNQVQDVGGGSGAVMHSKVVGVPRAGEKKNPLTRMWNRTYHWLDVGAQTADAWDES